MAAMKTFLQILVQLTWALWFGGLIALFIFVTRLFSIDRPVAVQAAPRMFHAFEMYQLALAAVAIASGVLWSRAAKGGSATLITVLFCMATVGSIVSPLYLTPQLMELQRRGESHTARFGELHGESMMVYMGDSVLLLAAGLVLPHAMKKR
jgi:hypothetical protein